MPPAQFTLVIAYCSEVQPVLPEFERRVNDSLDSKVLSIATRSKHIYELPRGAPLKAAELYIAREGAVGHVRLSTEATAEWNALLAATDATSKTERAHMHRLFQEFCEQQRYRFNDQQFKKQGYFPDGLGGEVAVWSFKAYQWRLYGFIVHFRGARCFVGARVDPAKKSDRADPGLLKATGAFAGTVEEYAISKGKDLKNGKSSRRHR